MADSCKTRSFVLARELGYVWQKTADPGVVLLAFDVAIRILIVRLKKVRAQTSNQQCCVQGSLFCTIPFIGSPN